MHRPQNKPSANQSLTVKSTKPEEKIIQDWPKKYKKVIYCHFDKKISDFNAPDFNDLEATLISIQSFDGVAPANLVDDAGIHNLLEYLIEEFPDFSGSEIDNAIKLKTADVFDLTEKQKNHYQIWSAGYLTPILRKYQQYRGPIISKYYGALQQDIVNQQNQAKPAKTPEQIFEENKAFCVAVYDNFLNKLPIFGLSRIYDILNDLGLIPYTEEKMAHFKEEALSRLKTDARKDSSIKSIIENLNIEIKEEPQPYTPEHREYQKGTHAAGVIENKMKELAVRNIFSYMKEMDTTMEDYYMTNQITEKTDKTNLKD